MRTGAGNCPELESSAKLIKEMKYGKNCRIWLAAIGSMVHHFYVPPTLLGDIQKGDTKFSGYDIRMFLEYK